MPRVRSPRRPRARRNVPTPPSPISSAVSSDEESRFLPSEDQSFSYPKEKEFVQRDSFLTDLFNNDKHVQALGYFWMVLLEIFSIFHAYEKLTTMDKQSWVQVNIFNYAFQRMDVVLYLWLTMFGTFLISGLILHYGLKPFIGAFRNPAANNGGANSIIVAYVIFLYAPSTMWLALQLINYNLRLGSAAILIIEQFRFIMKLHSYIRTVFPQLCKTDPKNEEQIDRLGAPKSLIYFLFAPTLIYRDISEYPRTKTIRLKMVVYWFSEAVVLLWFMAYIMEYYVIPLNRDYGKKEISLQDFVQLVSKNCFSGTILLCLFFYLVLHTIQNFFAELLKFGDRLFYKDWWTRNHLEGYYRSFNLLMHDWLYQYIYRDIYFMYNSHFIGLFAVYTTILGAHWYAAYFILGYAFPVLYMWIFLYFYGIVNIVPKNTWKLNRLIFVLCVVWYAGTLASFYSLEYYARKNSPRDENVDTLYNILIPRMFEIFRFDFASSWNWLCNKYDLHFWYKGGFELLDFSESWAWLCSKYEEYIGHSDIFIDFWNWLGEYQFE